MADFIEGKGSPLGEKIVKSYERLKGDRVNWDEYWEDLAEYFIPTKDNVYGYKMEGERKFNRLYDTTSIHSLELLASSFHGMLTNPSAIWFGLSTGDDRLDNIKEVRQYLQDCVKEIIQTLNKSNFQEEIHETYTDLGGIGTTVLAIEEDSDTDVRFYSSPIYSSYIAENEKGVIDTLYKKFDMTLRNIKKKYGEEKLQKIPELMYQIENKPHDKEEIIFCIEPDKEKKGKWKAYHVLRKHSLVLKEMTYHSFPFAVPRWSKLNEEVYGRCPAMKALPDVKMLNAVMRTTIRGMQKVVDPPLMVPDNGFLLPVDTTPGGTNFYRTGMKDRIELFPTQGARPDVGLDFAENIRARVREAFFIDQMQLINQRDMTATEVMQRTEERLRFLGPILGRLNNELLRPIIDRVFDILSRKGKLPQAPGILKDNKDLSVIYTSQIAKAQRTSEAETLNRVLGASAAVIQYQPDVMDNINGDEVLKGNAKVFGLPEEYLNSVEAVADTRKARADMQKRMANAEAENIESSTALNNSKAIKE
jgi:hypothetical protein